MELPKAIAHDRTERFSGVKIENAANTYFADIATELLGEPAWGLISAKLGKHKNLKVLNDRLWWAKDNVTLKRYFEEGVPDWNIARQNFHVALQAVIDAQKDVAQSQAMLCEQEKAVADKLAAQIKLDDAQAELSRLQKKKNDKQKELDSLENKLSLKRQNIATLQSNLSFFKRTLWKMFKKNPIIREWKQTDEDVQEITIQITRQRTAYQSQEESVIAAEVQHQSSERNIQEAEQKLLHAKHYLVKTGQMKLFGKTSVKMSVLKRPVRGLFWDMTSFGKNFFIRLLCYIRRLC